jgi:SIR2-like domain/TIR domain
LSTSDHGPADSPTWKSGSARDSFGIFINYRREDTAGIALAIYERLAQRFGAASVFLDVRNLQAGSNWPEEIKARGVSCRVFIALIGAQWMPSLKARQHSMVTDSSIDEARREIETALSRGSEVEVIPVLVDDAAVPAPEALPRSLRPLAARQVERVRYTHFDQDVEHLIRTIEAVKDRPPAPEPVRAAVTGDRAPRAHQPVRPLATVARIAAPDERHYFAVAAYMAQEGTVVPVLGRHASGLASDLSGHFQSASEPSDLAEAAQHVYVISGRPDLYRTLRQTLSTEGEPSQVHRFLARFPAILEKLGLPKRYQMIVTTNYDTELERAFDEANEPYDLAVYMSSGSDRGRFVHFPFEGDPVPIVVPNDYGRLPVDVESYELERTVIVKIHGAVDGSSGGYRWSDNYVITEDHFIEYLSTSPVETLVPTQILTKLRDSHCLFLGYMVRDWNRRVFLKRIWGGEPLGAKSWAIQPDPDVLDRESWSQSHVELFSSRLDDYVTQLEEYLVAHGDGRW